MLFCPQRAPTDPFLDAHLAPRLGRPPPAPPLNRNPTKQAMGPLTPHQTLLLPPKPPENAETDVWEAYQPQQEARRRVKAKSLKFSLNPLPRSQTPPPPAPLPVSHPLPYHYPLPSPFDVPYLPPRSLQFFLLATTFHVGWKPQVQPGSLLIAATLFLKPDPTRIVHDTVGVSVLLP